jgi:Family of unknown function (DUF6011)
LKEELVRDDPEKIIEAAKAIRSALRRAFPQTKISVTSTHGLMVKWTADEPAVTQVEDALLAAKVAEPCERSWDTGRWLKVGDHGIYFLHTTAAEQAAEEERRRQQAAEQERINARVEAVRRSKKDSVASIEHKVEFSPPPPSDRTVFEAFDRLRQRAESDVTSDTERTRRPTWAPPMLLGDELGELCYTTGLLSGDDVWIGRLWAMFATPKRSGSYLREHASTLPLRGISCRGFQFYAGAERGGVSELLFEAQRQESGEWRFGPWMRFAEFQSPRRRDWDALVHRRELCRERLTDPRGWGDLPAEIENLARKIDAIDALDREQAQAHRERQLTRHRILELTRTRVLDFVGAPDTQMQMASRLWGHCCICGKELTDPVSLERGIGPECIKGKIDGIKYYAANGHPPAAIAYIVGMPVEFVTEILNEACHV